MAGQLERAPTETAKIMANVLVKAAELLLERGHGIRDKQAPEDSPSPVGFLHLIIMSIGFANGGFLCPVTAETVQIPNDGGKLPS
jgi:hypothetical protein